MTLIEKLALRSARKAKKKAKVKRLKLKRPTNAAMVRKADILFGLAVRAVGRCEALGEHKGPLQGDIGPLGGILGTPSLYALDIMCTLPIAPSSGMNG